MQQLPRVMVAPNGARLQKSGHPAVPVTIPEIVETAKACFEAGAGGIHAHVRDESGDHVLDAGFYRELLAELHHVVPAMYHQITTEAVGRYSSSQQIELVRQVKPKAVSVALRELCSEQDEKHAAGFFSECAEQDIDVQHILYAADELDQLLRILKSFGLTSDMAKVLFVLGRYTENQQSGFNDLQPFLECLRSHSDALDWAVCAFGINETGILRDVLAKGGKVRIGFENNLLNEDGSIAASNQERVRQLLA